MKITGHIRQTIPMTDEIIEELEKTGKCECVRQYCDATGMHFEEIIIEACPNVGDNIYTMRPKA